MEKELQKMYDSEINVQISSFWDGEWHIAIGDKMNGYFYPEFDYCSLGEVISSLQDLIKTHYPNSKYVKDLAP